MTPLIFESADSADDLTYGVQGGGVTLRYIVTGTYNELDAYTLALATAPTVHLGFVRQNIAPALLGGPNWKVNVQYGIHGLGGGGTPVGVTPPTPSAPGGGGGGTQDVPLVNGYAFDTTGRTVKIYTALDTVSSSVPSGETARDFKGSINVSDGKVEGVDITAPALKWSRTVARASLSMGYVRTLKNATGKMNDAEFYGFPAYSVLYLGGTGQYSEGEGWTITHHFEHEEPQTDLPVGTDITVPEKAGMDYLWVYFKEVKDTTAVDVVMRPIQANVEQVLGLWNFASLEIGT